MFLKLWCYKHGFVYVSILSGSLTNRELRDFLELGDSDNLEFQMCVLDDAYGDILADRGDPVIYVDHDEIFYA